MGTAAEPAANVTAPRLLLDEMLSGTIAEQLRARRLDVIAVVEDMALVANPDEDLLAHAAEQQRVMVTANIADFVAIANDWRASGRVHHGIIYVAHRSFPQGRSFLGAMVDALGALCAASAVPSPGTETFLRPVPAGPRSRKCPTSPRRPPPRNARRPD